MPRACFVVTVIFTLPLSGCWEGISREVLATVLSVRGEVVDLSNASGDARAISSTSRPGAGSVLKTSREAQADLMLIPGALTQLFGDSELKIEQLKLMKDGNETGEAIRDRIARIELREGNIVVLFEGFARFTISTPNVVINVLPSCLFRLSVDKGRTRLTCVRGKVYVTPQNGAMIALDGGFLREWPSEGNAIAVTQDPRGQADTTAALQAARELQELDTAQRDRLPIN